MYGDFFNNIGTAGNALTEQVSSASAGNGHAPGTLAALRLIAAA
jgi:hypothetical protein